MAYINHYQWFHFILDKLLSRQYAHFELSLITAICYVHGYVYVKERRKQSHTHTSHGLVINRTGPLIISLQRLLSLLRVELKGVTRKAS